MASSVTTTTTTGTVAGVVRRQQRVDGLCSAAVRALAGDPALRWRGDRPDLRTARGGADGLALRRLHSAPDLAAAVDVPDHPAARLVMELLEQFRVESLAELPGVVANLRHRHEDWVRGYHDTGLAETQQGLLLLTLAQMCRARVCAQPVVAETEDLIEATRFALAPLLGEAVVGLRRTRADQASYAVHAAAIAERVADLLDVAPESEDDANGGSRSAMAAFLLLIDGADESGPLPLADSGESRVLAGARGGYRVFTRSYDQVRTAESLVRPDLLAELRERLDRRVAEQAVNVPRLARVLQRVLARPERDGIDDAQEEGLVDGRRLPGLIARPDERRIFRTERIAPVADTAVSFLVDCSGSMRRHNETVAMLLDVLVRALDLAGATTEVLGFTTGAWNGGRAFRDWRRAGRPQDPGRLNEVTHVVLKDAERPWRRQRAGIAALLKDDLFREGVDGEAVAWACARLRERSEDRRLLVVVSDGSPMDSATHLVNDPHYLDHHLRDVVRREAAEVRIVGLGVGLDLSPYYAECHALDLEQPPGNEVFAELAALLGGRRR